MLKNFVLSAAIAVCLFVPTLAWASCPTFHQLQNGTTADANQVMDNYNYILNCPNFLGNVGIGTSAAPAQLTVAGSGQAALSGTGNAYSVNIYHDTGGGTAYIDAVTGGSGGTMLTLRTYFNGTYNTILYGSATGNDGIGTTNPRGKLEVSGNILNTAAYNANSNLQYYDLGVGTIGAGTLSTPMAAFARPMAPGPAQAQAVS